MTPTESLARIDPRPSSQIWVFEMVLRAFRTGDVTYADVLARLRRLLATGTSPTDLLEILRRHQLTEPLPDSAKGVFDLLNDAIKHGVTAAVTAGEARAAPPAETVGERPRPRPYGPVPEPERAAATTGAALPADLAAARAAVAAEQRRSRDLVQALAERDAAADASRARVDEILRDYERQKDDLRTVRDSLAARDATLAQLQHSLEDRDSKIAALQQEQTKVPALAAEAQAALARADAIAAQLQAAQATAAQHDAQIKGSESRLHAALAELSAAKRQSSAYLEQLRTREWRREFDLNRIRELDAQVDSSQAGHRTLESERDRLRGELAAADRERSRLTAELAARDAALLQAQERANRDAHGIAELTQAGNLRQAELAAQIAQLRAEHAAHIERWRAKAAQREEEYGALMAQWQERAARDAQQIAELVEAADLRQAEHAAQIAQLRAEQAAEIEQVRAEAHARQVDSDASMAQLQDSAIRYVQRAAELKEADHLRQAEHAAQIAQLRAEIALQVERVKAEVGQREEQQGLLRAQLQESATRDAQRVVELQEAADARLALAAHIAELRAEHAAHIEQWQVKVGEREKESGLLMAQLQESATRDAQRVAELQEAAAERLALAAHIAELRAEHAGHIEQWQVKVGEREKESGLLMAQLQESATRDAQRLVEMQEADAERLALGAQIAELRAEHAAHIAQWQVKVGEREKESGLLMAQLQETATRDAQRLIELQEATAERLTLATQIAELRAVHAAHIEQWQVKVGEREKESGLLMAQLQEACRQIEALEVDLKRLTEELAAKSTAAAMVDQENRPLPAGSEASRDAPPKPELNVRRQERRASKGANALGQIQAPVERAKTVAAAPAEGARGAAAPKAARSAELIRIDGEKTVAYVLSKRTRVGRAAGCELQIDSNSVSRHHALVVVGPRETVIEDLNSTNGLLVNGRKVTRQVLNDGDALTIGETQFRYAAGPAAPDSADRAAPPSLSRTADH